MTSHTQYLQTWIHMSNDTNCIVQCLPQKSDRYSANQPPSFHGLTCVSASSIHLHYLYYGCTQRNRDNSDPIVTRLRGRKSRFNSRQGLWRGFSLPGCVNTRSGVHPVSYPPCIRGSFAGGVKLTTSTDVQNEWRCNPYTMKWYYR
jgi:hypothetical protein